MSETKATDPVETPAVESAQSEEAASSRGSSPPVPEEPIRTVVPSSSPPPLATIDTTTTTTTVAPTSTTTTEAVTTTPTTTRAPRQSPVDPRVVELRAMFPDYDDTILQSVLASVNYNQDLAVETLLTMSDPEYKPTAQARPAPTTPLTQEQLDEQFARQLLIQEQEQYSQWTAGRLPGGAWGPPGAPPPPGWQQGLHPQQQASAAQGQAQGQGQGMAEFQEHLTKFAETGKKTFGSIVSKVKAKISEFEQGRTAPSTQYLQQHQPPQQWTPGPASYYGPPQPLGDQAPASYATYSPTPGSSGQRLSPPRRTSTSPTSALPPPLPQNKPLPPTTQSPTIQAAPLNRAVSPTTAQPIDGVKLGLLPKRPVSLVRDDAAAVSASASASASALAPNQADGKGPPITEKSVKGYVVDDIYYDDDGLEYAENPFEEAGEHKK